MKKAAFLTFFVLFLGQIFGQLKDIKILIPKEIAYSYYDLIQFMPDDRFFVICGNSISVLNTETSEIIDEYELNFGSKHLTISPDGKYIVVSVNSDLYVFAYSDQKLQLLSKSSTTELISGIPNSQYYSSLPISGCFFTSKPNEVYLSIGAFSLLYDIDKKAPVNSFAFPVSDYLTHSVYYSKKNEALISKTSNTVTSIIKQSLSTLSATTEVISNLKALSKVSVRDSLLFAFCIDKYFVLNLETNKVIYEVKMLKYDYSMYGYDNATLKDLNKRESLIKPDTVNFSADEYVYDIEFNSKTGEAVFATSKGTKFINLKTKKQSQIHKGVATNIKFSHNFKRLASNGYTPYKAMRIFDPEGMKLISEHPALGNPVSAAQISPNNRWLYTNSYSTGYFWDLSNFTKYAQLKDVSGSDSSFINSVFFLNDSEVVVNSGASMKSLNLSIYNIHKRKYKKVLKKGVFALTSGFMRDEFYYCDYSSLHIVNLKTLTEEKYTGMFSLAASPLYQVINFSKELVFVPEATKFKIINRKTKKVEYESETWSVNAKVKISEDSKSVFTFSSIKKKKNINGYEVELPTNALVRIDMEKKQIVRDYAETYFPYDFKMKNGGRTIGVWYIKHDVTNYSAKEKETVYSEYDVDSGKETLTRTIATTTDIITYHYTSETGKYFALVNPMGNFFKVYNEQGELLVDLSDSKISLPQCFFIEGTKKLIVTSILNSLATFVDLDKKQVIGQLANAKDDNFFLITSNMHYLGSKEFVKNLRFKYNSEIFSFDQFDAYLNQPHKVLKAFGCTDTSIIKAYETAYLKRMRVLGLSPDAKINFSTLPSIQTVQMKETKQGWVNFNVSVNKGQNKLSRLDVFNNGTLIHSEIISDDKSARYDGEFNFETTSGINRFEFVAKDKSGFESPRISRLYNNITEVKPDLYLVVIASEKFKNSNYDLSYAIKDANDMANTMVNSKSFKSIKVKKMFNQSFSPDSVKNLGNFFNQAGLNDVVMVFFAGHGYLDSDLSYYFPTYYTDFTDPKINSVAYKSFEKLYKDMKPIRKLMFIDACFSGEVDEDVIQEQEKKDKDGKDTTRAIRIAGTVFAQSTALEMSKSVFSDLRQNSGATVISSAGGTEAAFEGEKWNNGLFTHCLLKGLKNLKADQNGDQKITLNELQKYVAEEVYKLSEGKQMPTYRMENILLDYELW